MLRASLSEPRPGRSFEGKAVCVIGPAPHAVRRTEGAECLTAGLVAAMLGAKVMFAGFHSLSRVDLEEDLG